ncbi:hypothetical protein Tco_0691659 [Tanacetum coccineum]
MTKLIAENEHLKQTYKQLFDSIKPARIRSKEQCVDLINQVNIKSTEISDLNANLQEKALAISALKDELRKLKGKALVDNNVSNHPSDPDLHQVNVELITPKLLNKRTAHSAYIHILGKSRSSMELVDHIKANYPLDPLLESAYCVVAPKELLSHHVQLYVQYELKCVKSVKKSQKKVLGNQQESVNQYWISLRPTVGTFTIVVQIVLWYLDSGCSKHMTGDRSQLTNFVNKFLGTVKFGNDHVAKIMGYGDYQIGNQEQEELMIKLLKVWELVPYQQSMVVTLKWIYKVKLDREAGGIMKNQARLVALFYPSRGESILKSLVAPGAEIRGYNGFFFDFAAYLTWSYTKMDCEECVSEW